MTRQNKQAGFTLLEIMIALLIFAILALLLSNALHNIIGVQSRTEQSAERLHDTQLALVRLSRDISQAVNRPVLIANGKEEAAFIGKPNGFTFTHAGVSNGDGEFLRSGLQRVRYFVDGSTLWRSSWASLDQAPQSAAVKHVLLANLTSANFEYLDSKNVSHPQWPSEDAAREVLPRAVRINLVINNWGSLSQLYVVAAESVNASQPTQPKNETAPKQ